MTKQTLHIFDGITEELIINETQDEFKNFSEDRKIQFVSNYAEFGCEINISSTEAEFISKKIIQYLDDVEASKFWNGDDYEYYEYKEKLEDYEDDSAVEA
jgi:hypothetical protein